MLMLSFILTIAIILSRFDVFCIDNISHSDLEIANRTCGSLGSCSGYVEGSNSENGTRRNCFCDQKCVQYGDCCVDSLFFNSAEQRRSLSSFECVTIPVSQNSVYMKTTCPASWKDKDIRQKCEISSERDESDPLLSNPVTGRKNSITYGNIFCAYCHENRDIEYWKPGLSCYNGNNANARNPVTLTADSISTNNLIFNGNLRNWQITRGNEVLRCDLGFQMPDELKNEIRTCVPDAIRSCAISWTNTDIRNRCEAYTSFVYNYMYNRSVPFRNIHCGICNHIPVQNLTCSSGDSLTTRFFESVQSFSVLFDFNGGKTVGKKQPCKDSQLYDPFFKLCRDIITDDVDFVSEYENDREVRTPEVKEEEERDKHIYEVDNVQKSKLNTCPKFMLNASDFILNRKRDDLYVPIYNKTFPSGTFVLSDGGSVLICVDSIIGQKLISKYKPYFGKLTSLGIGISILCLCLHLIAFFLVEDLRNLSGMNLASFSAALLIAYCSFMVGDSFKGAACFVNAVITFYFFLASFFWMLTIAFDVWRALRLATSELRVSTGKQWKKFFIYSIWTWLMPAKIVIVALLVEMSPKGLISEDFRPNFGTVSCWFGQGEAVLLFLGLPLTIVMVLNLIFFLSSSFMIYNSHSMTGYSASSDNKRNFILYSRLAIIMGLTWLSGLVAGFVDNEYVWLVFILLNTTQGLFIFIAFTCRRRVLNAITNIHRDSVVHLPTCSWSGASADADDKLRKQSIKTSTTYY